MAAAARIRAAPTLAATRALLSGAAPAFRGDATDQLPFAERRAAVHAAGRAFAIWGDLRLAGGGG